MIALLLMLTPPPPPPMRERDTPLPEYRADCGVVDADGRYARATVRVAGSGRTRSITVDRARGALSPLVGRRIASGASVSSGTAAGWSTLDAEPVDVRGRRATLSIDIQHDAGSGAELRLVDGDEILAAGLCRTAALEPEQRS